MDQSGAELLRNEFARDVMAELIPVAVAEFAAEAVQEDLVLVGVSLQLRREREDGNVFAFAQRLEPHVGIENILRADAFEERLSCLRIGIDLYAVAQGDDDKLRVVCCDFITHTHRSEEHTS